MSHLHGGIVRHLDAREGRPRGVALREHAEDGDHVVAVVGEVVVVTHQGRLVARGAWRDVQHKHEVEAYLVRPVERLVHLFDAAEERTGFGAVVPEDIPGNGKADGVEATRGDMDEVRLLYEVGPVLAHEVAIVALAERADEALLVQGPGVREQDRRDPRLERKPTGKVNPM